MVGPTHGIGAIVGCLAVASAAAGGGGVTITPVLMEGDVVTGVGAVTRIDNIAVNNDGTCLIEADTDHPDSDADTVVVHAGSVEYREGDALQLPVGASIGSFDSIVINDHGKSAWNFFLDGTSGSSDDSGIFNGDTLVAQESFETFINGLSTGTIYLGFFDVKCNDAGTNNIKWISVLTVDDPAIPSGVDRAIILFDDVIMGVTRELVTKEGDLYPGAPGAVEDFGTGPHQSAFNDMDDVMFFADHAGDTTMDGAIWIWDAGNFTLLAQEGMPAPIAGRTWSTLSSPELDLNNAGGYVFNGRMDGDSSTDFVIVKNGELWRQEGDPSPADKGFQLTSFGTGPLEISDFGEVLWYGVWNQPNPDIDSALFIDDTVLVQEGVTELDGSIVDTIRGIEDGYHMSDNGRFIVFEAVLDDGREGAFLIDRGVACSADVNFDGQVNVDDMLTVIASWGECPPQGGCPADIDGDGFVDVDDLLMVLSSFGPCS